MAACPREEDLLDALYAEYAGPLLDDVQRLVGGDRFQAEDVVQEPLLRAWRHAAAPRGRGRAAVAVPPLRAGSQQRHGC